MTTCMWRCPWYATTAPRRPSGVDRVRMSELCAESERRLGLTVVDGRHRGGLPGASRAETEAAARRGRPEPERQSLARLVRGRRSPRRAKQSSCAGYGALGVIVRPRYQEGGTTEVVGYSVALRPVEGERAGVVRRRPPGAGPSAAGAAGGLARLGRARRGGPGGVGRAPWRRWPRAEVAQVWSRPDGPTRQAGSTSPSSAWAGCRRGSGRGGPR